MKKTFFYKALTLMSGVLAFDGDTLYASAFPEGTPCEEKKSLKRERSPRDDQQSLEELPFTSLTAQDLLEGTPARCDNTQKQNVNKKLRTRGEPSKLLDAHACRLMMVRSLSLSEDALTPLNARIDYAEKAKAYGEATLLRNENLVVDDVKDLANLYFDAQDFFQASALYEALSLVDDPAFSLEDNRKRAYLFYHDGDFEEAAELYYQVVTSQNAPLREDYDWALRLYNALLDELGNDDNLQQRTMYHQRVEEMTIARDILAGATAVASL